MEPEQALYKCRSPNNQEPIITTSQKKSNLKEIQSDNNCIRTDITTQTTRTNCRIKRRSNSKTTTKRSNSDSKMLEDGCLLLNKYLTKQIIYLPIKLFLMFVFIGKLEFEKMECLSNGKYKAFVNDIMRKQNGGPIVIDLNQNECNIIHNDCYKYLSGWESYKRIDL
eukprot:199225_1